MMRHCQNSSFNYTAITMKISPLKIFQFSDKLVNLHVVIVTLMNSKYKNVLSFSF